MVAFLVFAPLLTYAACCAVRRRMSRNGLPLVSVYYAATGALVLAATLGAVPRSLVILPIPALVGLPVAVSVAISAWSDARLAALAERRRRQGCPRCGYSLIGIVSGICPECGTPIEQTQTSLR
ncbi:MAG: hypothetical protein U1A27_14475 [Phycisphaerae bacterium]